jgi:DNA modification methylase
MIKLYKGDCLIENENIESGSVDLILTDLPYGTMEGQSNSGIYHQGKEKHEWDNIIPNDKIMEIANRILRKNGKMILFAQEPFTNKLMNSAIPNLPFNYRAIWLKDTLGSFMRSKKALLYKTEDILIYSKSEDVTINPVKKYTNKVREYINKPNNKIFNDFKNAGFKKYAVLDTFNSDKARRYNFHTLETYNNLIELYGIDKMVDFKNYKDAFKIYRDFEDATLSTFNLEDGDKYKSNVFEFKRDRDNYHPTQKPVLLLEDLIKTFSNENDLVVDLTMGSGSTLVACKNTNRNGIGIEMDEHYYAVADTRVRADDWRIF